MTLLEHVMSTEKNCDGQHAVDIHCWMDAVDRSERHHLQALPDALKKFSLIYMPEDIEAIFLQHLKDDFNGEIPNREDYKDGEYAC